MAAFSLRYARAFAQVVDASGLDSNAAQQQLADFSATLDGSRELREILMNPSIVQEQKVRILDAIAGRIQMFPQVRNFLAVITEHQRLGELAEILSEYATLADSYSHVIEAEITSAHDLNDDDRLELERQLTTMAGEAVRASYAKDASLLGGVVVKIGATIYDGSVKAQLAGLKRRMSGAQLAQ